MNHVSQIRLKVVEAGADAILLTEEKNQRYACGFPFTILVLPFEIIANNFVKKVITSLNHILTVIDIMCIKKSSSEISHL